MQRIDGDMIVYSATYVSFESSATVEPQQHISNIYIYLYVSDQSVFIGSELYHILYSENIAIIYKPVLGDHRWEIPKEVFPGEVVFICTLYIRDG